MTALPPPPPPTAHAAGWYADPWRQYEQRYWDGAQWTQHVHGPASGWSNVGTAAPENAQPAATAPGSDRAGAEIPLFGARSRARELAAEVQALRAEVERLSRLD